jgi:hypothetical protein
MLLTFVSSEMAEDDGMDANDENVDNGRFFSSLRNISG